MKQISVVIIAIFFSGFAAAQTALPDYAIRLGTNIHMTSDASNVSDDQTSPRTGSLEPLKCVLDRIDRPYSIITKPWRRAYQEVRKGVLDGFFTAISLNDTQRFGTLTEPLVLENWYWFWREDMRPPVSWREGYRLGSILGSQQELWLAQENFPKTTAANNLPQLVKMLFSGRIDVVLADKEQFEDAVSQLADTSAYRSRFFRYVPLGVYFGHLFLSDHPDFLLAFNEQVPACIPGGFALSGSEKQIIEQYIAPVLQQWLDEPVLIKAIEEQNQTLADVSDDRLDYLNELWQSDALVEDNSLSDNLLEQPGSVLLRQLKKEAAPMITEVIAMGVRGVSAAISDRTSNLWHQQEAKYQHVFGQPQGTLFVDEVIYDESSRHFQVNVSTPVYAPGTTENIGVLMVGVDVEQALSLDD